VARFELFIKPSAVKELERIPSKRDRQRIATRIRRLADDPRPPGCQKLSGRDRYRIRQGVYRIVYSIRDQQLIVVVIRVGHRKDIYRGEL
jgi:mRNA interferase RelE/StbE